MTQKMVLLLAWGRAHFDPPPSLYTLRSMVRTGKIEPAPVKVGKSYYVDLDARVVDPNRRLTLVERLQRRR
jgi:hypothetical protein